MCNLSALTGLSGKSSQSAFVSSNQARSILNKIVKALLFQPRSLIANWGLILTLTDGKFSTQINCIERKRPERA